ncbi:hypothetical protein BC938DRAFT_474072 [Jimgerdemannia flammicorona]|uniref:NADH:ubiquinone reductase (non-electrogenic) n=1 Tax=Jimgerdemannia flammicorona TaxID=994334 RepID=A0A433QZP8_9FUNG|nr:hypothetical protein BC938DRAFT_474072 [Jimgerdemannia flammicorona]
MQATHFIRNTALRVAARPLTLATRQPAINFVSHRFESTIVQPAAKPWRSGWRILRRTAYVGTAAWFVYGGYNIYTARHPLAQAAFDPEKKTIVILGSGWASTAFLKDIDTVNYNVVCIRGSHFRCQHKDYAQSRAKSRRTFCFTLTFPIPSQVIVSPRNYFLFTPLLPSTTVGTVDFRSIIEPIRYITRHKSREVKVYEAECSDIDPVKKTIVINDNSEIKGSVAQQSLPYDYLIIGTGCQNATFGIKGVEEYACFLKEVWDAQKIRTRLMDCIETAAFAGQPEEEIERLLHMVVVGGGPTGVEYAAELHDFLKDDLVDWYPDIAGKVNITLVEALQTVLPVFSKQLIEYTETTFKEQNIKILTKTMVKEVRQKEILVKDADGSERTIPYGLLVWATGNTTRPFIRSLMEKLPESQTVRRGLAVDELLRLQGAEDIWALGDVTATKYAPTAQVASQQGKYLARMFNLMAIKDKLEAQVVAMSEGPEKDKQIRKINRLKDIKPFHYSHQGSLAYIGSEKAIADLPLFHGNISAGGVATYVFWRSAYLSNLFSIRNRTLVAMDWIKKNVFGRDISRE